MSRSLGVADSKADIDEGTITGITVFKTATGGTIGLYGKVPVVQRVFAASLHNTSAMVTSAGSLFQATHVAQIQEIQNTLIGLGIWATA
jgi:phosphosulfolactate phosphohydrolase-like enzyme